MGQPASVHLLTGLKQNEVQTFVSADGVEEQPDRDPSLCCWLYSVGIFASASPYLQSNRCLSCIAAWRSWKRIVPPETMRDPGLKGSLFPLDPDLLKQSMECNLKASTLSTKAEVIRCVDFHARKESPSMWLRLLRREL